MRVKGHFGNVELVAKTVIVRKSLRGENRIPVNTIQSIETGPAGPGMRFVRFATAASAPGRRPALGSHRETAKDPNALTYRTGRQAELEQLLAAVQQAMTAG